VRILLASAALAGLAACVAPLQQGANCPAARHALAASRTSAAAVPPPTPAAPAARPIAAVPPPRPAVTVAYVPLLNPATVVEGALHKVSPLVPLPPEGGRLTLSNFSYDLADVEAIVTRYPDCALHPGIVPMTFKLPLNSTWVIRAPAGADVCWRRQLVPQQEAAAGAKPGWSAWNRDHTGAGQFIDSQL
jgi:hypothetical protein